MKKKKVIAAKDLTKQKIFKTFTSEVKVADDVKRTLIVTISTPNADRSKDTVMPSGMQYDNFLKNPVVLFAHEYNTKPIAKCTSLKVSESGVMATVEFLPEGDYDESDIIYKMYKNGFLNAWSIGFMPLEYDNNDAGGYEFKKWELFEFSSVPVPDNPEALTIMRSKGISEAEIKTITSKPEDEEEEEKTEKPEVKEAVKESKEETKEIVKEEAKEEPKTEVKAADENEADSPTDDTPITELTVGDLKDILEDALEDEGAGEDQVKDEGKAVAEVVKKDVGEVIALAYILDQLSFYIWMFEQEGVKQSTLDKLNQALVLVMDVVQEQATLGQKEVSIPPLQFTKDGKLIFVKEGRTISSANEEELKSACDHMDKAAGHVKGVLSTVSQQNDNDTQDTDTGEEGTSNADEGKSASFLERLSHSVTKIENSQKTNNQKQDLALRLLKQITSES